MILLERFMKSIKQDIKNFLFACNDNDRNIYAIISPSLMSHDMSLVYNQKTLNAINANLYFLLKIIWSKG